MDKITISKAEHERLTMRDFLYSQAIATLQRSERVAKELILRDYEKHDKGDFKIE